MQKTYDRITIPKIVVCSKASVDDRVESGEDCERRSLNQRKMIRSRNRRHSRRFSTSIVDRRSPSSSRSPSPSFTRSQSHTETSNDDHDPENEGNNTVDTIPLKKNGFLDKTDKNSIDNERTRIKIDHANDLKSSSKDNTDCTSRHSRCCRCSKGQNNGEENRSGYQQYLQLLQVPQNNLEWGEGSGDDLSSEWESDHTDRSNERTISKVTARNAH